jgi:hypothetical protein
MRQQAGRFVSVVLAAVVALWAGPAGSRLEAQAARGRVPTAARVVADEEAQAQAVLDGAVLRVGGLEFPRLAPGSNGGAGKRTSGVACCTVGDTRTQEAVASIDLETPHNYPRKKWNPPTGYVEKVYSPPQTCWVISSYTRVVTSANGPGEASEDAQPGNFSYLTASEFESVQEAMEEYIAKLDILGKYKGDLNAKIKQFIKNYGAYSNSIKTSHGQVRHLARVQGQGSISFKGRSWYRGHIRTTETCCPPEVTDAAALRQTLTAWVDQTAAKLPRLKPTTAVEGPERGVSGSANPF